MQKVRLRQARRHRKALLAVQGKPEAILERPQESRRRSRWSVAGGYCRRENEEEIRYHFVEANKMIWEKRISFIFCNRCYFSNQIISTPNRKIIRVL